MPDKYRVTKKKWDESNPEIIRRAKKNYDAKNPTWSFRPTPELKEWLEEERWDSENGKPESNSALVIRKLEKLRKLEAQGY